jgi:carbon monoxide dehydrogenase subunit G
MRGPEGVEVTSDRWFTFPAPPEAVWKALQQTDLYPSWWPWLTEFEADGLHPGATWGCAVRSPLRTTLRFRLLIDTAADRVVAARLDGDLAGTARITLQSAGAGDTRLRLEARVRACAAPVAVLTRLAPPVARWSHDRIVATGARQFAAALLRQPGTRRAR